MKMFYTFVFGYHEYCGTILLTHVPFTLMQIHWVCCAKSLQLCLTLWPHGLYPPASSVRRILLARILPCASPGGLPDAGIEHASPAATALQVAGGSLPLRLWENPLNHASIQFRSVQSFSCVQLFETPRITAHQASLCVTSYPRVYSNPCPLSQWRHPTISSSVVPSSSLIKTVITVIF